MGVKHDQQDSKQTPSNLTTFASGKLPLKTKVLTSCIKQKQKKVDSVTEKYKSPENGGDRVDPL